MPDHIHILIGIRPSQSISDLIKDVKQSSSLWINKNKPAACHFEWQEGFGAFSYSKSQIPNVINYIQKKRHTIKKEHLKKNIIDFLKILK